MKAKTLNDLETEAAMLGISRITLARTDQTWNATAFGEHFCIGSGEGVSAAYEDLIHRYRLLIHSSDY